jgi:hypothetical protein
VTADEVTATWRSAQLGEVSWVAPDGAPACAVVVPLLDQDRPALALPYARLDLARSLAAAGRVRWSVVVPALAGGGTPVHVAADVTVAEDPRGERFVASKLLDQVLAKHPPDRRRLDSPLLRREHAWYLPRLLVTTSRLGTPAHVPRGDAIAVVSGGAYHAPDLAPAGNLDVAAGTATVGAPDGPAVVLQHGADVPDLEQPWHRRWRGAVVDGRFSADQRDEVAPRGRRLSLRARIRAERVLERACRNGLRADGLR